MVNQQRVVKQSSAWLARKGKNAMNLKSIQKVKISTSGQKKANKFLNGTAKSMLPYSFDLSSHKHTHIHLGRLAVTVGCTFAQLPHWHVANRLECQPDWSPVLPAHCCRPHGTEIVDHTGGRGVLTVRLALGRRGQRTDWSILLNSGYPSPAKKGHVLPVLLLLMLLLLLLLLPPPAVATLLLLKATICLWLWYTHCTGMLPSLCAVEPTDRPTDPKSFPNIISVRIVSARAHDIHLDVYQQCS